MVCHTVTEAQTGVSHCDWSTNWCVTLWLKHKLVCYTVTYWDTLRKMIMWDPATYVLGRCHEEPERRQAYICPNYGFLPSLWECCTLKTGGNAETLWHQRQNQYVDPKLPVWFEANTCTWWRVLLWNWYQVWCTTMISPWSMYIPPIHQWPASGNLNCTVQLSAYDIIAYLAITSEDNTIALHLSTNFRQRTMRMIYIFNFVCSTHIYYIGWLDSITMAF